MSCLSKARPDATSSLAPFSQSKSISSPTMPTPGSDPSGSPLPPNFTDSPPSEEISPPPFVRGTSVSPYHFDDPVSPAQIGDFGGPVPGRSPAHVSPWSGLRPREAPAPNPAEDAGYAMEMPRAGEHSRAKLLAEHASVEERRRRMEVRGAIFQSSLAQGSLPTGRPSAPARARCTQRAVPNLPCPAVIAHSHSCAGGPFRGDSRGAAGGGEGCPGQWRASGRQGRQWLDTALLGRGGRPQRRRASSPQGAQAACSPATAVLRSVLTQSNTPPCD